MENKRATYVIALVLLVCATSAFILAFSTSTATRNVPTAQDSARALPDNGGVNHEMLTDEKFFEITGEYPEKPTTAPHSTPQP